jgi:signal transduction histidine kinase
MCLECEPLKANLDVASVEETLKAMTKQFTEFKGIVQERDSELESISMELALGLSEVFEALKQISSGDPLVRIPETSELEMIAKLKHMVNLTAENLGEIVDLSHEFAIGLAEHFNVLHRVSEGDLSARIFGTSQVELLEYLKKVTNEMIESVYREITERKRAEEQIQGLSLLKEELLRSSSLDEKLKRVTDGVVEIFDADFCRIWLTKPGDLCDSGCFHAKVTEGPHVCQYPDRCLHLVASSGRYTHTDGGHRRVPFGCYKIGRVASADDAKFLSNDVTNDPRVHDRDWARNLGLVSFAGYRLLSEAGASIGVLALFAKHTIFREEDALIEGLANTTAQVIQMERAQDALVGAKEDWENTFDSITDMVMLLDNEHHIMRVNKAGAEALNATKEALAGKRCYEAVHGLGHPIKGCPLLFTMKALEPNIAEITEPRLGGSFICSTSPILNREGKLSGYTHSLKDITDSKHLEAQLQQAQKMEAIGTLAGGIAHDFNNLLMGIQGNVSLMLLDRDEIHPDYERLKNIEKQVQGGARLTSHLLGYARKGGYEIKPIAVNRLVEETSRAFGRTKKAITIHRELAEDLCAIEADPGQIEQILWNMYVNAADAMPKGGDLFLKTMNVTHKDMKGRVYNPKPGNYVLLAVTDTGMGMDKETMERVFDPFFTTKEMGHGTGLGLASAYGITKAHGGYIDIDSKKGQGATFSIYLRASERKAHKAVKTSERFIRGTETVLLVDDEDVILKIGRELFEAMGYRVLTAKDGQEALKVYKKNQDNIDIVVLDMVMPTMGGGEAYDRIKEINSDVKVLLSSGFSIDGEASEILERGCDGFIQKPFNMNGLSGKIREVLERK